MQIPEEPQPEANAPTQAGSGTAAAPRESLPSVLDVQAGTRGRALTSAGSMGASNRQLLGASAKLKRTTTFYPLPRLSRTPSDVSLRSVIDFQRDSMAFNLR